MPTLAESLALGDTGAVDAAFKRAFDRVARHARELHDTGKSATDPIGDARALAGKNAYARLGEIYAKDALAKTGAERHVVALCLLRIGGDVEAELAAALHAPHDLLLPGAAKSTFVTSRVALVREKAEKEQRAHIDVLGRAANAVAQESRELGKLSREVCEKLGLPHPVAYAAEATPAALAGAAHALLDSTESLAGDVRRRFAKRTARTGAPHFLDGIALARVDTATEGWPARAAGAWLAEVLRGLGELMSDPKPAPPLLGASSFVRVLVRCGEQARVRRAPRGLPFVVAHDPWPRAMYRAGIMFGMLATTPELHKRGLGLATGRARDQALDMMSGAIAWVRFSALRVLTSLAEPDAGEFEELTRRVFGAPVDPRLRGAFPLPAIEDGARFVALLEARTAFTEMVDRFDADWFANPRAGKELAGRFAGPMRDVPMPEDLGALVRPIVRAFEEALG